MPSIRCSAYDLWEELVSYVNDGCFQEWDRPVNERPKTNSFAGISSLGVFVLVTDNLEGSISWTLAAEAALAWMLYDLAGFCHAARSVLVECSRSELCGRN